MLVTLKLQIRFYSLTNELVILNPGKQIYVDSAAGIGFVDGHHFDIGRDEYVLPC